MALPDSMESSWLTLAVGTITMTAYPYRRSKDKTMQVIVQIKEPSTKNIVQIRELMKHTN
jgi:hypothetical protein